MLKEDFLNKVRKRNPNNFNKYQYTKVAEEFDIKDKILIICNTHGEFKQRAFDHIYDKGCSLCGAERRRLSKIDTLGSFIRKANEVHNRFYSYPRTTYKKSKDKITITCPTHGDFEQTPSDHLQGKGCKKCGLKLITRDNFLSRIKDVHSDKYLYPNLDNLSSNNTINIVCPTHGLFTQVINEHLRGRGCKKCGEIQSGATQTKSLDQFIKEANDVHDKFYTYLKFIYNGSNVKGIITCPVHGDFLQTPNNHLTGSGCPTCVIENRRTKTSLEYFLSKVKDVHGDDYTYGEQRDIDGKRCIDIHCKKHGIFTQLMYSHLNGSKCPKCVIENSRYDTEEFIRKAILIHGNKDDYSKVDYKTKKIKVIIICKIHGEYLQTPGVHLQGSRCPVCSESHGEKHVAQVLDKYNIKYIREYKILPYRYKYDFYLPDYDIYIEYHGIQHYKPIDYFGGAKALKDNKERDKQKVDLVKNNNGLLIIIPYTFSTIEQIEKQLIYMFKLKYRYWYKDSNNKILVFKNSFEVFKHFNLDNSLLVKSINNFLNNLGITLLF